MDTNDQSRIDELRKKALEELNKEEKAKADMGLRLKKTAADLVREVSEASQKPYGKRPLVRSKEFEHLADTLEYYLEWMNENIEHMAR